MNECIFCKIINGDIPSYKLYEDNLVFVFLDINPDSNGHTLIIPKTHYKDIDDIDTNTFKHIGEITKKIKIELEEKLNIDGLTLIQNNGDIQEVIPEVLCGIWTGTNWTGMGANGNTKVTIEKDGTVKYVEQAFQNVTFDYETMTIYGSGLSSAQEEISIVITYDEDTQTIDITYNFVYDGENYNITGKDLTKSE